MESNRSQQQQEALSRATGSMSMANYPAIIEGFLEKGISEMDIRPRENVFTYAAWRALGRTVRRGEHGVRILIRIPVPGEVDEETGEVVRSAGTRPKTAVVFHVSQTDPLS